MSLPGQMRISMQSIARFLLNTDARSAGISHVGLVPFPHLFTIVPRWAATSYYQVGKAEPVGTIAERGSSRPRIASGSAAPDGHFVPRPAGDVEDEVVDDSYDPRRDVDNREHELVECKISWQTRRRPGIPERRVGTHADANDPPLDEFELWWQDRIPRHRACVLAVTSFAVGTGVGLATRNSGKMSRGRPCQRHEHSTACPSGGGPL